MDRSSILYSSCLGIACLGSLASSAAGSASWEIMNGPLAGRIEAICVDPTNGDLYVARSQDLHRSTDGGSSWQRLGAGTGMANLYDVSARDGEILVGVSLRGAWWSTNSGASWDNDQITHNPHSGTGATLPTVLIDLAGNYLGGSFRSTNNGTTWSQMSIGTWDLSLDGVGRILAAAGNEAFRSTNGGATWQQLGPSFEDVFLSRVIADAAGHLYAGSWFDGIFRSTNDGASWTAINSGLSDLAILALAAAPDGRLYAANHDGLHVSVDNGNEWNAVATPLPSQSANDLLVDATGRVVAGTTSLGVHGSMNGGESWTALNGGLHAPWLSSIAVTPGGALVVSSISGGLHLSADAGFNWEARITGLPEGVRAVAASASGLLYAATTVGPYVSADEGATWAPASTELQGRIINEVVVDASSAALAVIEAAFAPEVHRSLDDGASWELVFDSNVPSVPVLASDCEVDADGFVYLSSLQITGANVIHASSDQGETWAEHVLPGTGNSINTLAAGPGALYFARSTAVLRSTDHGASWGELPEGTWSLASCMEVAESGDLFVGTQGDGVYLFSGSTWQQFNDGLPDVGGNFPQITSLTIVGMHLFAGTYADGLFRSSLAFDPAAVADGWTQVSLFSAPNPFTDSTVLTFELHRASPVRWVITDASGRKLRTIAAGLLDRGTHHAAWDGRDEQRRPLPAGVYFSKVEAAGRRWSQRIVLAR